MEVKTITTDGFFRVFTACPQDPKTFILDVRSQKDFVKQHVMQAYCIRLAANGRALLVSIVALLHFLPRSYSAWCFDRLTSCNPSLLICVPEPAGLLEEQL